MLRLHILSSCRILPAGNSESEKIRVFSSISIIKRIEEVALALRRRPREGFDTTAGCRRRKGKVRAITKGR